MKTIKKVAVTPVTPNTGDIIDSFNTTDDKHTNAPSINAVEQKVSGLIETESETIMITVRGRNYDGTINMNTSTNGTLIFNKRCGIVSLRTFIGLIATYNTLFLYNSDGTAFTIPEKYKTMRTYPKTIDNYNNSSSGQLIIAHMATGQVTLNDQVIFEGTYIDFRNTDGSGQSVNGNLYYGEELVYMAKTY